MEKKKSDENVAQNGRKRQIRRREIGEIQNLNRNNESDRKLIDNTKKIEGVWDYVCWEVHEDYPFKYHSNNFYF